MVKARKILYVNHFDGEPKPTDFFVDSEELPSLKDGGRISFISVLDNEKIKLLLESNIQFIKLKFKFSQQNVNIFIRCFG